MKDKSIVPTDREKVMRENDFIVSKTDLQGKITYGNRIFQEFAGYTEKEILGVQHNVVRHPDMPRAAFNLAWTLIKAEQEFFGYVKNLARDGSFYWVFTHITPSYNRHGKVIGYLSVRRKPNTAVLPVVAGLYQQMLDIEKRHGPKEGMDASTQFLLDFLAEKKVSYEELVLSLQG